MPDPPRVLLVASDREAAADLTTTLEHEGEFTVTAVERLADAFVRLADDLPACLLLVAPFPEMETVGFLETVRATYPSLPVVVLAGGSPELSVQDVLAAGATEVIDTELTTISAATLRSHLTTAITRQHDASTSPAPGHRDATATQSSDANVGSQLLALLWGGVHAVVAASTRPELEREICEQLLDTGLYTGIWYGDYDPATNSITPRAQAGLAQSALEELHITVEKPETEPNPYEQAIRTEDVAVVPTLGAAAAAPWRDVGREQGATAMAVAPVTAGVRTFGMLTVYTARPDAFGAREQAVLADLGALLGHAYLALERKATLLADTSVELELTVRDEACPFVALTTRTPATCTLDDVVAPPDGPVLVYVTVTDATSEQVRDGTAALPAIEAAREVRTYDDGVQWELALASTEPSMLTTLAEHGAVVQSLEAADGEATVVAELTATTDFGAVVAALQAVFPETEVVAKRTHDRPVRTVRGLRAELAERLTDKQFAALREAYAAGYFERPRHTTGPELAASMGVSPSTYHQHLDIALAKVIELLLAEPDEQDRRPMLQP